MTGNAKLENGESGVVISNAAKLNRVENGNVISGNNHYGIWIYAANENVIAGNKIGTNAAGMGKVENGRSGVYISDGSEKNEVIDGNVISGNTQNGVYINGANKNIVQRNKIGVGNDGTTAVANGKHGVQITSGDLNKIGGAGAGEGNKIGHNTKDGVWVESGVNNPILGNSIFDNGELGIDLGPNDVTPNDDNDGDNGANDLQNFPIITRLVTNAGITTVHGRLHSTANTKFRIEIFANDSADPSGHGEGKTRVGVANVITNGEGNAKFSAAFAQN